MSSPAISAHAITSMAPSTASLGADLNKVCPTCGVRYPVEFKVCPRDATELRRPGRGREGRDGRADHRRELHHRARPRRGRHGPRLRGRHTRIGGKRFAVKMLHPSSPGSRTCSPASSARAEAAATIDSPYVVDVYDVDRTTDGRAFLVAEFLQGKEFANYLDEVGKMAVGSAVRVVRQICKGAGGRARQGRRPPGHEAGERVPHRRSGAAAGQGDRLRHLQGRRPARHRAHQDGMIMGTPLVHGAGAGPRRAGRPPGRHLRGGRHPLLRAHGQAPLRSRRPHGHAHRRAHPGSPEAPIARAEHPPSRWR